MAIDGRRALGALMAGDPGLSRRGFLRGTSAATLLGLSSTLTACGIDSAVQTPETCPSTDVSASDKRLFFSNWPEYIDVNEKGDKMPSLERFKKQAGLDVTYNTDVNDNNEFFAKVQNQLGDCQPVGRDIFVLTDWMAARMVTLGWIQALDHANLPNVEKNLKANLRSPDWDPTRDHSVPWQSGLTGIAYNAKFTREVRSMEELLTRDDLKGRISLLREMRDTMGFTLKLVGADPSDFDSEDWGNATDRLEKAVRDGQVRRFTGNDYVDDLNKGDLLACEAWSGDVIAMQYDNADIKFVLPEEGVSLWSDNMLVPNKARHKANAEKLMNYYYEPEVAATLSAWVNYICPVEGAQEAMKKIDDSLVDNPLIFPDKDFLAQTWQFMDLPIGTQQKYDMDFSQAVGG